MKFAVNFAMLLISTESARENRRRMKISWLKFRSFHWPRVALSLTLGLSMCVPLQARTQRKNSKHPTQGRPVVEEVSPPNWWSGLPNPMLLLQGKNLNNAEIASSMAGISVRRTKVSANGHWAFVWLDISAAPPQQLDLLVRTPGGKTQFPYQLEKRHAPTDGFQGFSSADVMYLVMPDRFCDGDPANDSPKQEPVTFDRSNPSAYHGGDLVGIENHLDYIQQLGATTLWITPIYAQNPASAADYSGYRPDDLYRVNPHFGSVQDYENLAQALHTRGMKLVMDMVLNHVSPSSPWVLDPPAPNWFHGTPQQHLEANADFALIADPHSAPAAYQATVDGWLSNELPDLNQSNPLVKQYLIQNAVWWIESGAVDGLRLDTFANVDRSFWQDFHAVLRALYPHLTTVGEIFNPDPTVVSYFAGGVKHEGVDTGLYTPFDFPTYFALRGSLSGTPNQGPMPMVSSIERQDWLYPHPERLVTFFGNQDTPRFLSEPGATPARLRLAFGLTATMRGMPQIYYGDEIALTGQNGAGNRSDFPGGFPGDQADAFTAAGRTPQQEAMHAWVVGLLQLRAHHDVLQTGMQQNLLIDDTGFVFARLMTPPAGKRTSTGAAGEIMLVLMNKSAAPRAFHLNFSHTALDGVGKLTPAWNTDQPVTVANNACDVTVGPEQLIVLSTQP
jgi:glycosidase